MKLDLKCVNAHDRCFEGGPCPLCEAVSLDEKDRCPMWLVVALTAISIGATVVLLNPSLISFLISRL